MMTIALGIPLLAIEAYALLYLLYLWAPALAAMFPVKSIAGQSRTTVGGQRSFAILISAHNEEAVVGALLRSLGNQHYPTHKRRVYVVANNCTDATANLVRTSGLAACLERVTGDVDTKGAALAWLWERMRSEASDCDCVLVLDADNLVPPDFLTEMNCLFQVGYRVVQSTRCAKNADDSWVSQMDAISEALWNRLDQTGRRRLGLSATIAGSGMAFESDIFAWLMDEGAPSLLEDIEWQARLMLARIRIGYAERARVYDEKTSKASQLGRQRKRWVAGVAMGARRYGRPLLVSGIRSRSLLQLSAAFGVTKPPRSLLLILMGLLGLMGWLFPEAPGLLPWPVWAGALGSFAGYVLLGMALDRARPRAYVSLLFTPIFAFLMVGASLTGALRASRQRWTPTAHGRGMSMDELRTE